MTLRDGAAQILRLNLRARLEEAAERAPVLPTKPSLALWRLSARGAGAHYLFVIPTLGLVIVHRTDNDPPVRDAKTIAEMSNRGSVSEDRAQFGHLLRLILNAQTSH
jgi:hypothetical protein